MSVLFANTRAPTSSPKYLVEFKAGRTEIQPGSEPGKRKAVAQEAKGAVYLTISHDNLLHFCWKNRDTNKTEDDYIIFPGDAEFLRIKECTDGRVYMLKFKTSDHRHLYWMQEPNAEKDEETCKRVNELLNNPQPQRVVLRPGAGAAGDRNTNLINAAFNNIFGGGAAGGGDVSAFSNMDQNQIMQFLMGGAAGGAGGTLPAALPQLLYAGNKPPNAGPTSTAADAPSAGETVAQIGAGSGPNDEKKPPPAPIAPGARSGSLITPETLAAVFAAAGAAHQKSGGGAKGGAPGVDLSQVLTRSNVQQSVRENAEKLRELLPNQAPLLDAEGELEQTVGNPQFQQASDFFGQAFQLGQLAQVLPQFGLGQDAVSAAQTGDLLKFAEKLSEQEGGGAKKDVNKEIESHADEMETAESSTKKSESEAKKADESKIDLAKKPPREDDNMDLD